jgi:hypothetical protein
MNLVTAVAPRLLQTSVLPLLLSPLLLSAGLVAPSLVSAQRAPGVDVWFDQGNEFNRGQPGRVMYSGDAGTYVTVLRVDTDGRVTVMSPIRPNSRSRYAGGQDGAGIPFQADPVEGVGYVFAVASRTPFDFRNYTDRGNRWNMGTLGERGGADPFEIVDRFARSSVGARGSYSIAYAPYEIGRGGAGRAAYQHGVRYDDGYGYYGGYDDPWGASQYRQGYNDFRYSGGYGYTSRGRGRGNYGPPYGYGAPGQFSRDPRTHYLRHCPDGTLAPYTTPCRAFSTPHNRGSQQQTRPNYPRPNPMHPPNPHRPG